jgi:spore protease
MGITGIETFEIVRGVVDRVNPDIIIIIDSLASRKAERVSTTIQIADTGITPGSGVGNKRVELTRNSLGRPVIAVGVPTVIDAATLASDAISLVLDDIKKSGINLSDEISELKNISNSQNISDSELIRSLIRPYYGSMIVTPKEIDEIIKRVSSVIADGINLSLGTIKN